MLSEEPTATSPFAGYKLVKAERHLRAFARFAAGRDEAHIRTSVLAWLATIARTPGAHASRA